MMYQALSCKHTVSAQEGTEGTGPLVLWSLQAGGEDFYKAVIKMPVWLEKDKWNFSCGSGAFIKVFNLFS